MGRYHRDSVDTTAPVLVLVDHRILINKMSLAEEECIMATVMWINKMRVEIS